MKIGTRMAAMALLAAASIIPMATGASAAVATPDSATRITSAAATRSYHEIVNYANNQSIEAPGGVLNVRLRLARCNPGSRAQKWAFVVDSSSANTYYLVNQAGGFCAEVNNGTSTAGEAVDEYFCNGTRSEQWARSFRVINGVAYQHFTHAGTDLCLDTVSGPGSQLMQWFCGPWPPVGRRSIPQGTGRTPEPPDSPRRSAGIDGGNGRRRFAGSTSDVA